MSPQQLRGRELDVRTDIFSFGCSPDHPTGWFWQHRIDRGEYVYFSRRRSTEDEPQNSIRRIPVEDGEEKPVIEPLDSSEASWDVSAGGIEFVDTTSSADAEWVANLLSFADRGGRQVTRLQGRPVLSGPAFSVSSDGRRILSVQLQSGSDLMLVEDFR